MLSGQGRESIRLPFLTIRRTIISFKICIYLGVHYICKCKNACMNPSESILDLLKRRKRRIPPSFLIGTMIIYYCTVITYWMTWKQPKILYRIVLSTCGIASGSIHSRAIWIDSFSKWLRIKPFSSFGNTRKDTICKFRSLKKAKRPIMFSTDESTKETELLYQTIDKLPEKCRKVFLMACLNDKTYQEIADELGTSINTVKTQMKTALKFFTRKPAGRIVLFTFTF